MLSFVTTLVAVISTGAFHASIPLAQGFSQQQSITDERAQRLPPPAPPVEEIIVEGDGLRELEVDADTPASTGSASRVAAADSQMFVRCARPTSEELLRGAIDGPVDHNETKHALDRIIRMNSACYPGYFSSPIPSAPFFGNCNPMISVANAAAGSMAGSLVICRSFYDRGALVERVLAEYAPDLKLTRADTGNREVQRRFSQRENRRGKHRKPSDRMFTDVATCLVMLQPERAIRLLRSEPGSDQEARLRALMIDRARTCVGNARNVTVDPAQFRIYIADAVYGWAVALRGVESLLPTS